jgi:hypothetical protein
MAISTRLASALDWMDQHSWARIEDR